VLSFDEFKAVLGIQENTEGRFQLRRRTTGASTSGVAPGEVATALQRATSNTPGAVHASGHLPVDLEAPQMPTKELLEMLVPAAAK
jgi:hypothetical protein